MPLGRALLVVAVLACTFLLVYSPHLAYKYRYHYDEWRSMTAARRMAEGIYERNSLGFEAGFHVFLRGVYAVVDLVDIYRFLPALWALIGSVVVFFYTRKCSQRFWTALAAMVFFASIRSSADNLLGLWFFTPLSFAIPLIYGFVWLFGDALGQHDIKKLAWSALLYAALIVSHPISATFLIPLIVIHAAMHRAFVLRHWRACIAIGAVVVMAATIITWTSGATWSTITSRLVYDKSWDGFDFVPLTWGYSFVGVLFALLGAGVAWHRRQLLLLLWPATTLALVFSYHLFGNTIAFAPYSRMFYYFILGLPILSAYGLTLAITWIRTSLQDVPRPMMCAVIVVIVALTVFGSLFGYPEGKVPVQFIDDEDVAALRFLGEYDASLSPIIVLPDGLTVAAYAVSGHPIIGEYYFNDERTEERRFFTSDCATREGIIKVNAVAYVVSRERLDCGWQKIYDERDVIYRVAP